MVKKVPKGSSELKLKKIVLPPLQVLPIKHGSVRYFVAVLAVSSSACLDSNNYIVILYFCNKALYLAVQLQC